MRRSVVVSFWIAGCGFQPAPAIGQAIDSQTTHVIDARFDDAELVTSSLAVTVTTLGNSNLDLTAEGTIDWAHWGYQTAGGFDRRNGGTTISDLAATPTLSFIGAPFTASWTDGAQPNPSVSMTSSGVGVHVGSAMVFTVAADTTVRTLRLYVGVQTAAARLDLALSDGSQMQTKMLTDATGTTNVCYAITFNAASSGQKLSISWTDTGDYSGIAFAALLEATLH